MKKIRMSFEPDVFLEGSCVGGSGPPVPTFMFLETTRTKEYAAWYKPSAENLTPKTL